MVAARETIGQRELRNQSGAVMRRVEAGETFTVTRNGTAVATLSPHEAASTDVPLARLRDVFTSSADVDIDQLRADLDAVVDQSLQAPPA